MSRAQRVCASLGMLCVFGLSSFAIETARAESLLLATTTSVQDSGLLAALLPSFTRQTGIRVQTVAVGTGAALRMGAEGNADVLLTHAPRAEKALVESGAVDERVEIMENYFVLAAPPSDPAGLRASSSVEEMLRRVVAEQATFVSRGDDSGTHKKEIALFEAAGLDPSASWPGLTRTGSGMGLSLQIAGQKQAYILSDVGTFLAFQERTGLISISGQEACLRNTYSILRVNPKRFPRAHASEASALIAYLQAPETQEEIARFGTERFGRPLFTPLPSPSD
ncbi:MAG: substrate-binding domain-containing protein [Myxococcota bacterium]|nr:substrate-binding domain-containing protein [Myxococcota bacterium]